VKPSEIKKSNCVFDKEVGLNNIQFLEHCIIKDGEFLIRFIQEGKWVG